MHADLLLALELADEIDVLTMQRYRADDLQVEDKLDSTPVTEADRGAEQHIRGRLSAVRPEDGVIGEEFPNTLPEARRQWVVDPIDGTKNYVRGVPVWGTLIALLEDGEPVVGVVSAPAMARRWWAASDSGAFTRDVDGSQRQIRVSLVDQVASASFSFSDHIGWDRHGNGNGLINLQQAAWRTRGYGDFWSHLLVAEGAVDIAAEPELNSYDMAAFVAIVRAAGGIVTGYDGTDPFLAGNAVSTNGLLHAEVLELIAK